MKIDTDTKLFFSVAGKPGNFGSYMYNSAFEKLGINAIYKPLQLDCKTNFDRFFDFLFALKRINASGLSVSMPFKKFAAILGFYKSEEVKNTNNSNTLKFEHNGEVNSKTYCYNTDCLGFEQACENILSRAKSAVIFGTGAVADSIAYTLNKRNINFFYTKNPENLIDNKFEFLINATPVGMDGIEDTIFNKKIVKYYKYVFDVVVKKETNLIKLSKNSMIECVSGWAMSKCQLREQFKIYTGQEYPEDLLNNNIKELGYE